MSRPGQPPAATLDPSERASSWRRGVALSPGSPEPVPPRRGPGGRHRPGRTPAVGVGRGGPTAAPYREPVEWSGNGCRAVTPSWSSTTRTGSCRLCRLATETVDGQPAVTGPGHQPGTVVHRGGDDVPAGPLPVPDTVPGPAVQLFCDRARAVRPVSPSPPTTQRPWPGSAGRWTGSHGDRNGQRPAEPAQRPELLSKCPTSSRCSPPPVPRRGPSPFAARGHGHQLRTTHPGRAGAVHRLSVLPGEFTLAHRRGSRPGRGRRRRRSPGAGPGAALVDRSLVTATPPVT